MSDLDVVKEMLQGKELSSMSLEEIARVIRKDWKKVNFGAVPYLEAMGEIDSNGMFMNDPWNHIVAYFLGNANTWKGPVAKEVKAELKKRLKKNKMARLQKISASLRGSYSKARVASMSDSAAWKIVDEIGWSKNHDYKSAKKMLLHKYKQEEMDQFAKWVSKKYNDLYQAVDAWEKKDDDSLRLGDDSTSDCLHHAIGISKKYYEDALKKPEILKKLNFHESFAYCIPYNRDYELLSPQKHIEKARKWEEECLKPIRSSPGYSKAKSILKPIEDIFEDLVSGKFSDLPSSNEVYRIQENVVDKLKESHLTYKEVSAIIEHLEGGWLGNVVDGAKMFHGVKMLQKTSSRRSAKHYVTFKGEQYEDNAPDMEEYRGRTYYRDDEIFEDNDDIGYYYCDQDGGEGPFWSLTQGGFV